MGDLLLPEQKQRSLGEGDRGKVGGENGKNGGRGNCSRDVR